MGYITFPASPFTAGVSWLLAYCCMILAAGYFYLTFIEPKSRAWSLASLVFFITFAAFGIYLGHNVLASII